MSVIYGGQAKCQGASSLKGRAYADKAATNAPLQATSTSSCRSGLIMGDGWNKMRKENRDG
jgi:hypothetical protein